MFRIETVSREATAHVIAHMRAKDRREVMATRWNDDPVELLDDCTWYKDLVWNAFYDDEPVAILGLHPVRPGVWQCWMFATDKFDKIAISLTKFAKSVMIPEMIARGAHRVFCHSIEGHEQAHRWLEHLGVRREGTAEGHGRNGEDFHVHVWKPEHVRS